MSQLQVNGYDILEQIGVGSFSVVHKAVKKDGNKETVAVKCLHKTYQKKTFSDTVVKEISLLKLLKHEHIVKLIDFMWDTKYIFIITEYCNEGDLSQFIRKKHKLCESLVKVFMQQLAAALKFLQTYNICHMDLKPQNLLLVSKPVLIIKMADFGLSQIITPDNVEQTRYAGSILYMAPEKLLNKQFDSRVDLWSVGIIMYECLFGRAPFINLNVKAIMDVMSKNTPIELPSNANISDKCKDLMFSLLKYNPNERISFADFFQNEFLDLIHMPTSENYLAAFDLIQQAINLDQQQQYTQALSLYSEGVKYLEAFISCESNASRKAVLNVRLNEYKRRINALNTLLSGEEAAGASKCQPLPLNENQYEILLELSSNTPKITNGLDIGFTGELYINEGKTTVGFQKLTSALSLLLPMLQNEPPGIRRNLLYVQIQRWLNMAEEIKASTTLL